MPRRRLSLSGRTRQETRDRELHRARAQVQNEAEEATERPRRRRNGPTTSIACNASTFLETELDCRLQPHSCGEFTVVCTHCRAKRWPDEKISMCCQNGKVRVPLPPPPPPELHKYYDINRSGHLLLPTIRSYNNALALASVGCEEIVPAGFNPTFKIQGKLYHRIGNLLPAPENTPKFAQIFFHDADTELQSRLSHSRGQLDHQVLHELQQSLHVVNSYVQSFKSALEVCKHEEDIHIVLHATKVPHNNAHTRTYNLPACSEVAAILPGTGQNIGNLDIVVRCRNADGQELRRISTCHRSYDPLHYVLMFPTGCDGWHLGLKKTDNRTLTAADFYAYRLQVRENDFNIIFKLRKLLQQYAVDQWAKIEASRLEWARHNQRTIRAEKYQGLIDAAHANDDADPGMKVILPPTIYGSPRFYSEAFQDAMTIVRQMGKPDIFITFTCNPKWPEITAALNAGEQPFDRPDLSCRVFKQKYNALMDDLLKKEILGVVKAHTATIEFQKRGLPHAHILLILDRDSKPNTPDKIDNIVSAEIPNKDDNPQLHQVITSQNVHGPCGNMNRDSPCMSDGKCTKSFPKPFQGATRVSETSYPSYRRRSPENGGGTHSVKVYGADIRVDNSFIVPYNPTLSLRYKAHINVEIVHTVQAVKYLYKYVTKGQDRIIMGVRGETEADEISRYVNARYISASEAFWRLYGFEIHRKHPPVEKLPCHLPNQQTVMFQPGEVQQVVDQGPPTTKLTAFFQKNNEDESARTILYPDFPHYFTWNQKDKKWQRRKRGVRNPTNHEEFSTDCIGRIPTVSLSPHQTKLYYLRMLLHHRPGATSYDDLKHVNGTACPTFQEACKSLGLLEDDNEKDAAMEEAASIRFGPQLRLAFATILIYCRPADPLAFWNRHKLELSRDILIRDNLTELNETVENQVLLLLQGILDNDQLELQRDFQLPPARPDNVGDNVPQIVREELSYNTADLETQMQDGYSGLNDEQKIVFDSILDSINTRSGKVFALDACGGTGKTHTINLILAAVHCQGKIALSGIAATLLNNGRTLHSRCKVPLNVHETSMCNVSPRDATGVFLARTELLIIDEISMGNKFIFEAIDRTLQDIKGNSLLFGGITVLLAGDWRQILPVIRHGSRPQIVNATLKMSYIWDQVTILRLKKNMRVQLSADDDAVEFSDFLLRIGDGREPIVRDIGDFSIHLPAHLIVPSMDNLLEFVFGDLTKFKDSAWLASRAIICPTNAEVDELNKQIMRSFPGEETVYKSSDTVENEHQYPLEFINSLCPSGMPPHILRLKQHSIIMLLRNLDPTNGHCNGTRYIVDHIYRNIIDARIACGPHAGKRLFIPRIPIVPSDNIFPFEMKRKQFPVRPAFAITANKAQGQTLKTVGIYLQPEFFSHGQLYVAMSRVGSSESLRVYIPRPQQVRGIATGHGVYTSNVVYPEVLRN